MNLEQVAHFIEHPQELTLSDAPALHALSEKYPFASLFSLLYLKALANGKSVDLDSALQQHAYRLNDRRQLFQLVHNGGVAVANIEAEAANEGTEPKQSETAVVTDIVHASVSEVPVIESVAEPTIVYPEAVETATPVDTTKEQEEDYKTELQSAGAAESIAENEVIPETEDLISFEQMTDAFTLEQTTYLSETPKQVETAPLQTDNVDEPSPVIPSDEKRSFTDWLKSSNPAIPGLETESQPRAKSAPAPETTAPAKPKVEEIIDTFIREEPTISRNKTEFFSPSKKAKESLDDDALPVSETLAKIYAAQGNYPKAIHVYHQLMLSVPEKRSLFAIQIDALKKKITP